MKLIALPDVQETSDVPCDTGSDPGVLEKEFVEKGLPVDLGLLRDGWNNKFVRFAVCCEKGEGRLTGSRKDAISPPIRQSRIVPVMRDGG